MTAKKAPYLKVLTADPVMRKLIETHDLPRIGKSPIFISLVRAIISQQLSEAAASTIFKRLSSIAEISPENLSILAVDKYRTCGISSRKAEYILIVISEKSVCQESLIRTTFFVDRHAFLTQLGAKVDSWMKRAISPLPVSVFPWIKRYKASAMIRYIYAVLLITVVKKRK